MCLQIPFRYNPLVGIPPRIRTGYYYLPSGWQNRALPVMVLLHGLSGYGLSILYAGTPNQGSQSTFQVCPGMLPASVEHPYKLCCYSITAVL